LVLLALAVACAPAAQSGAPRSAPAAAVARRSAEQQVLDSVDIALARTRGQKRLFEWQPLTKAAFEQARRERRYVLLNSAAEWCHWCHVMDATTYKDPNIGRVLRDRFVTIRVDVDARPGEPAPGSRPRPAIHATATPRFASRRA
jgi:uncharacterized protein